MLVGVIIAVMAGLMLACSAVLLSISKNNWIRVLALSTAIFAGFPIAMLSNTVSAYKDLNNGKPKTKYILVRG